MFTGAVLKGYGGLYLNLQAYRELLRIRWEGSPLRNAADLNELGDRMDLILDCIRRHYAGEPENPLPDVTNAYKDFFELFRDFKGFVEFFH